MLRTCFRIPHKKTPKKPKLFWFSERCSESGDPRSGIHKDNPCEMPLFLMYPCHLQDWSMKQKKCLNAINLQTLCNLINCCCLYADPDTIGISIAGLVCLFNHFILLLIDFFNIIFGSFIESSAPIFLLSGNRSARPGCSVRYILISTGNLPL